MPAVHTCFISGYTVAQPLLLVIAETLLLRWSCQSLPAVSERAGVTHCGLLASNSCLQAAPTVAYCSVSIGICCSKHCAGCIWLAWHCQCCLACVHQGPGGHTAAMFCVHSIVPCYALWAGIVS